MTGKIKDFLMERVNSYIAKQLWQKISTELDAKIPTGELADERARFPWMVKRASELIKEFTDGKETED